MRSKRVLFALTALLATGTFAQPAAPVMNLLMNCKKVRPEIWKQMTGEINAAFEERINA